MDVKPNPIASSPVPPEAAAEEALPPGTPSWITPALLSSTRNVWASYFPKALTNQDALEILMTIGHLSDALEDTSHANTNHQTYKTP